MIMNTCKLQFVWQRDSWVTPVNLLSSSRKCQGIPFSQTCRNSFIISAAAPLVLAPFVRSQSATPLGRRRWCTIIIVVRYFNVEINDIVRHVADSYFVVESNNGFQHIAGLSFNVEITIRNILWYISLYVNIYIYIYKHICIYYNEIHVYVCVYT